MSLKKKLLCLILCTVIVSSLSITVWADTISSIETGSNSVYKFVQAKYDANATTPSVYSVDISWGDLQFAYSSSQGIWQPASHSYTPSATSGWNPVTPNGNLITVTNHSNVAIQANVSYVSLNDTI
ncbi:MAG: hypothetical protein IJO51_06635, partial [Clostridia bacterium]|nr:hypothetical protein [Clostridia bacterium]